MKEVSNKQMYDYSEASVKSLIEWARNAQLPQEIRLSASENIFDVHKFVDSEIANITSHYPDSFYNPSIDRLYRLKEAVEASNS